MKAHYDRENRDLYIFLTTKEIRQLLDGSSLVCDLYYYNNSGVLSDQGKLELLIAPSSLVLAEKYIVLTSKKKNFNYQDPILLELGESDGSVPYILTLEKGWSEENLSEEVMKRCGGIEIRYGGGCKIIFYSNADNPGDDSYLTNFFIIENHWRAKFEKPE